MREGGSRGGGEELREQLGVLWRRKWWIVAAVIITMGVAVAKLATETDMYRSTANVLLRSTSSLDPLTGQVQVANAKALANEAELAGSSIVAAAAAEELGRPASVTVSISTTADQLEIQAVDADPTRATETANVVATTYIRIRQEQSVTEYQQAVAALQPQVDELQAQIDGIDDQLRAAEEDDLRATLLGDRTRLSEQQEAFNEILDRLSAGASVATVSGPQVIDAATPAADPFEPKPARTLGLALAVGLVLGVAAALFVELLDDTVKSAADLERVSGHLTLATIPRVGSGRSERRREHLVGLFETDPSMAPAEEAMRSLRTAIQFLGVDRRIRSIVVTSASPGEGKTTTVANLAASFAEAGKRVIALSTDLRKPRLHSCFGVPSEPGLSNVLLGQSPIVDVVARPTNHPSLIVLPSGPVPPNPAELLSSSAAEQTFDTLGESADILLFDSPPLLPVADGVALAARTDAVILVVSYRRTRRRQLVASLEALDTVGAHVIGCVLTRAPAAGNWRYGYGYGDAHGPPETSGQSRRTAEGA
jgi:capsular exopolysaccharide synthesis family protein